MSRPAIQRHYRTSSALLAVLLIALLAMMLPVRSGAQSPVVTVTVEARSCPEGTPATSDESTFAAACVMPITDLRITLVAAGLTRARNTGPDGITLPWVNITPPFTLRANDPPPGTFVVFCGSDGIWEQVVVNDGGAAVATAAPSGTLVCRWYLIASAAPAEPTATATATAIAATATATAMAVTTATATVTATTTGAATATATSSPVVVTGVATSASAETLTFAPSADTYVEDAAPEASHGAEEKLLIDGEPIAYESYLRFDVSGLTGGATRAVLRLFAVDGSADGPAVFGANRAWSEETMTWTTRPALTSTPVADAAEVTENAWLELDVTALIGGDGAYAFALLPTSTNGADFSSREAETNRPELVITFTPGAAITDESPSGEPGTVSAPGTLGGTTSRAADANDAGEVVGAATTADGISHAFAWVNGAILDLAIGGAYLGEAIAVNEQGHAVGSAAAQGQGPRAILWSDGVATDLGTLGGDSSVATDINDADQIVGFSLDAQGRTRAFRWSGGQIADLGALPSGEECAAFAINAAGQIVGVSTTGPDQILGGAGSHAVLWTETGEIVDLGVLPGHERSIARAISDGGLIAGDSSSADNTTHAVLWTDRQPAELNTLTGNYASARDVSEAGRVVGVIGWNDADGQVRATRAVLWDAGVMTDLNGWLPDGSGWFLTGAEAITDGGRTAGRGYVGGVEQAYLLVITFGDEIERPDVEGDPIPIAFSQSTEPSTDSGLASDGSLATAWRTTAEPAPASAEIKFDLGGKARITAIQYCFAASGGAGPVTIAISTEPNPGDTNWTMVAELPVPPSGSCDVAARGQPARWIRFTFTNPGSLTVLGNLAEVRVFGDSLVLDPTPTPPPTPTAPPTPVPIAEITSNTGSPVTGLPRELIVTGTRFLFDRGNMALDKASLESIGSTGEIELFQRVGESPRQAVFIPMPSEPSLYARYFSEAGDELGDCMSESVGPSADNAQIDGSEGQRNLVFAGNERDIPDAALIQVATRPTYSVKAEVGAAGPPYQEVFVFISGRLDRYVELDERGVPLPLAPVEGAALPFGGREFVFASTETQAPPEARKVGCAGPFPAYATGGEIANATALYIRAGDGWLRFTPSTASIPGERDPVAAVPGPALARTSLRSARKRYR